MKNKEKGDGDLRRMFLNPQNNTDDNTVRCDLRKHSNQDLTLKLLPAAPRKRCKVAPITIVLSNLHKQTSRMRQTTHNIQTAQPQ
mmetsp:Transcript_20708/g.47833  ORF Transcript_20708/g.47833 Transcript_20708/m.47833 type:complete len:85 (-) Transcript_20708:72-326(-)